jgi:hypothetical protein
MMYAICPVSPPLLSQELRRSDVEKCKKESDFFGGDLRIVRGSFGGSPNGRQAWWV